MALRHQGLTCSASSNVASCHAAIDGILIAGANEWYIVMGDFEIWFQVIP